MTEEWKDGPSLEDVKRQYIEWNKRLHEGEATLAEYQAWFDGLGVSPIDLAEYILAGGRRPSTRSTAAIDFPGMIQRILDDYSVQASERDKLKTAFAEVHMAELLDDEGPFAELVRQQLALTNRKFVIVGKDSPASE